MNIQEATSLLNFLFEASETDAYKYSKRSFSELDPELQEELKDNAKDPEHWMKDCFHDLCTRFGLRNSESMYYAPGLVRIAYGELDMDGDEEQSAKILLLRRYVDFITTAHKNDFNRFLVYTHKNANGNETKTTCTFDDLDNMFGEVTSNNLSKEYEEIANKKYKSSNYEIIWLKDFETAHKYLKYTYDNPWCYFEDADTFESYTNDGLTKLYLAVTPGFENLEPGDKGYGQSMLGIDIDPGTNGLPAVLLHVSNRYNHDEDPELNNSKNPAGDNRFNAEELSDLLGKPFWEACPPYTKEELNERGVHSVDEYIEGFSQYLKTNKMPDWLIAKDINPSLYTIKNTYGDESYIYDLRLRNKSYIFNDNGDLIARDFYACMTDKTDMLFEMVNRITNGFTITYYVLDHNTKEIRPLINDLSSSYNVDVEDGPHNKFKYIVIDGYNDYRIITGKDFDKELKLPAGYRPHYINNSIYCARLEHSFEDYILFKLTEDNVEFLYNGAVFSSCTSYNDTSCILLRTKNDDYLLYSTLLERELKPDIKHIKSIDIHDNNVVEFCDDYDNMTYYKIMPNGDFKCIIPLCSDISLDPDYGCYIAKRGGNRGFDIYNINYKFIDNISSLKYLPKLMRK